MMGRPTSIVEKFFVCFFFFLFRRKVPVGAEGMGEANLMFCTGDRRANVNPCLMSLHVIFLREHNRLATMYKAQNPTWTDDDVFHHARALNIAQYQHISIREWIPALVGPVSFAVSPLSRPVGPGDFFSEFNIQAEFSQGMCRAQHNQLSNEITFYDDTGKAETLRMFQLFFNPGLVRSRGVTPIVRGLLKTPCNEITFNYPPDLLAMPEELPVKFDMHLAAKDCFRSRDHGLPDFSRVFRETNGQALVSVDQITKNAMKKKLLLSLYPHIQPPGATTQDLTGIDLWAGGFLEDNVELSSFGQTFTKMLLQQYEAVRLHDSKWYERLCSAGDAFSAQECAAITTTTFSMLILRNTKLECVQREAFRIPDDTKQPLCRSDLRGVLDSSVSFRSQPVCAMNTCPTLAVETFALGPTSPPSSPADAGDGSTSEPASTGATVTGGGFATFEATLHRVLQEHLSSMSPLLYIALVMSSLCFIILLLMLIWICFYAKKSNLRGTKQGGASYLSLREAKREADRLAL
eukprot:GHVT01032404.1.p1 GENE.GHVT01032404.1~~GHVT01032404.1.p1  ORF type:complete len:520 (-),score=73.63 GHVT01032404.1:933-2492(-)